MGLLFRILRLLFRLFTKIIKNCLIDAPYANQLFIWLVNLLISLAIVVDFSLAIYMFVYVISLEIFVKALIIAYLEALGWSKFSDHFTSFGQEMYLIGSTVGYTVLVGIAIQIHRMQWADGNTLLFYWIFLLIFGFIMWGFTVLNVSKTVRVKPVLAVKKIEYKQRFHITKLSQEIPTNNQAQTYLKKMK